MEFGPARQRPPMGPWVRRFAAAGLTALAACTLGPDFKRPEPPATKTYTEEGDRQPTVPEAKEKEQHFELGKKISGQWWSLFRSQRLNEVLDMAVQHNLTLVTARATLAQAQQAIVTAQGAYLPQLDLTAGASRQRVNNALFGSQQQGPIINLFSIGPTVSYALDIWGLNRRRVEQQEALAEFQTWQLDAAYLTLTGNAVNQALQIASARAQIDTINSIIADDERNLKLVQSELAAGEATQIDVQSAASQLAADRTLLPPVRQQLSAARHALSVLVGKAPSDWVPPDFDLSEFTLPEQLPVSLPSELVRQRPDILSAEAQLHAASAAIGVATAQQYPNITLSASLTQEALQPHNLFNPMAQIFNVGSQLTAPIFHGGELEAQKQAAIEAYNGAVATYQQTVLTSFQQVADVMQALGHDAELIEAQRRALESADRSLSLTRTTYAYGNVGVLQVLDAQRLSEQARLGFVRAEVQRQLDTVQLFTAMGGGWWDWQGGNPEKAASAAAPAVTSASAEPPAKK